jgi:hypothetical protein
MLKFKFAVKIRRLDWARELVASSNDVRKKGEQMMYKATKSMDWEKIFFLIDAGISPVTDLWGPAYYRLENIW